MQFCRSAVKFFEMQLLIPTVTEGKLQSGWSEIRTHAYQTSLGYLSANGTIFIYRTRKASQGGN